MKKPIKLLSSIAILSLISQHVVTQPILAENNENYSIQFIEENDHASSTNTSSIESSPIDEISQAEGISGEQIVVQINQDGFVTSHGDHYHYFNGSVPADAIFSEAVLTPEEYVFDTNDIVSETEEGQIVTIEDNYYLYLKDPKNAKNIRSLEEVLLQSYSMHPQDAKNIYDLIDHYHLGEEAIITYELERSPEQVAKAKEISGEHVVVYLTEEEFVTNHAFDLHVFYEKIDPNAIFSEELLTPEDYQLDDKQIVSEIKNGYIIKIEDQYLVYIPSEERANADNIRTYQEISKQIQSSQKEFKDAGSIRKDTHNTPLAPGQVGGSGSRNNQGAYVTDDGYVFSPYDVLEDLGNGFIVPHGDHFHFIPKSDLTSSELAIAMSVLSGEKGSSPAKQPNQSKERSDKDHNKTIFPNDNDKVNKEEPYKTNDGYVFSVDSITKVTQDGLVAAHDSHFHYIPFAHLNKAELAQTQAYIKKKFGINRNLLAEYGQVEEDSKLDPKEQKNHDVPDRKKTDQPDLSDQTTTRENGAIPTNDEKEQNKDSNNKDKSFKELLEELYALPLSKRHVESDGLIFDPAIVTDIIDGDFIIPHGDHHHVIPRSQLSDLEIRLAEMKLGKRPMPTPSDKPTPSDQTTSEETEKTDPIDEETKTPINQSTFLGYPFTKNPKGQDGKPYTTSDGYLFNAESILNYSEKGLTASHGDHTHFIPYGDLEDGELLAASKFIQTKKVNKAENNKYSKEEIEAKLAYVSLENGVNIDQLEVNGNDVIIPHGNHSHTANLDKIPTHLSKKDYNSLENYTLKLISMKMSQARRNPKYIDVRRKDNIVYCLTTDYKLEKIALDDIKLPIKFEPVTLKNVKTNADPNFDIKIYVAQKYKVNPANIELANGRLTVPDETNPFINKINLAIEEIDLSQPIEETTSTTIETTVSSEEEVDEEETNLNEEPSLEALKEFVANFYGLSPNSIQIFSGMVIIANPNPNGENLILSQEEVLAAYLQKASLPTAPWELVTNDDDKSMRSNNTLPTSSSLEESLLTSELIESTEVIETTVD